MTPITVTTTRPLTATFNGKPFTIPAGHTFTAEWVGWDHVVKGGTYRLHGALHGTDGRRLRVFPGYEPIVRVDRLHRAATHVEPLYRYCDHCHGTGRNLWLGDYADRRSLNGPDCTACAGTAHAKTYPANAEERPVVVEFYRDHRPYKQQFASEPAALQFLAVAERAKELVGWTLIRPDGSHVDLSGLEKLPTVHAA